MASPIPFILAWSHRYRAVVAAGAIGILALSAIGARRLTFDTDVLSLLPRDGRVIPAFRTYVEHFGSLDDLYVVFTAPPGQSIGDYQDEIDHWIDRLRRSPAIARVDTGLVDRSRDLQWLADRQLLLLRDGSLDKALGRLRGDDMRAALGSRRELLAVPSPAVTDIVRTDPLGLFDLLRDDLGGAQAGINLGVTEGGYLSRDGRSRLVIALPARPPYDTAFSRSLLAGIERLRAEIAGREWAPDAGEEDESLPPLQVEVAGGHRIAVETEVLVRRESILNTIGSLALILPLLYVVFRSFWLVTVGPLPSGVSLLVVLGALGLAGATLSAAATASAAMLFGLGIDGVVLMYVAATRSLGHSASPAAAIDGLSGSASSMLLGMWTTAATFYGMTFVDFPSLQQLGALIGHSMMLCGIFTLVMVPAFVPRRRPPGRARQLTMPRLASWVARRRVAILVTSAVTTAALGVAASHVRINPTLDRLRSVTPGAEYLERIGPEFGLPQDVYVILQRGGDLNQLLAANERIAAEILRSVPSVAMQAGSALLPSPQTQERRVQAIRRAGISAERVAAALARAGEAEGFKEGSFEPFRDRLPRLLAEQERLSYDAYVSHGLADLVGRFVKRMPDGWLLVSYAFPPTDADVTRLEGILRQLDSSATLTGLSLVNRELGDRFLPQFLRGLGIGTTLVLVLIVLALRNLRLSLLSVAPTAIGLVWAAGILALARVELDLFALFAVVTFLGIGVDYGVHLVHRYRECGNASRAIQELAPVILVAAAITLLGYGTLVTSSYPPLRSIGSVSVVTVVTLAIASLIVLPALLSGSRTQDAHA